MQIPWRDEHEVMPVRLASDTFFLKIPVHCALPFLWESGIARLSRGFANCASRLSVSPHGHRRCRWPGLEICVRLMGVHGERSPRLDASGFVSLRV